MQFASAETVLGDFSDISLNFHNVDSRTYKKNERYFIDTIGADGEQHNFEIKYTFGFSPLQQYLVETENGHIQALNIAWDSRPESEGGQRWMHLRAEEEMDPEHIFFWTRHFQNWNSRCADCHSTNVKKNYNDQNNTYQTTWSEINVACEACHGPASRHVDLAQRGKLSDSQNGFSRSLPSRLSWQFDPDNHIAKTSGAQSGQAMNMCGRCHSSRTPIADYRKEAEFHNVYRLQLLRDNSYFPDGQIREEVFVMGSFLQSKMFRAGVTCTNCHDPHSGAVKIKGNGLCTQCHKAAFYDAETHHHHTKESAGAACINCHMPSRTYMRVDARRDHSFVIPQPQTSHSIGAPNPCEDCHEKQTAQDKNWVQEKVQSWTLGKEKRQYNWGVINHKAGTGDVRFIPDLIQLIDDETFNPIIRATLLDKLELMPSRASINTAINQLNNVNPMIRRAAAQALSGLPIENRWHILLPHINDESASVRFTIAPQLAEYYAPASVEDKKLLSGLLKDYRKALSWTEDAPSSLLSIANLETHLENYLAADRAYQQALQIEPAYVPALLNYAQFLRNTSPGNKVESLLRKAVNVAPDSGLAQHSFGLHLIRQQLYKEALPYLYAATQQSDAISRFGYVYAVALQHQGSIKNAIQVLSQTNQQWPNRFEVLLLLVNYLEEAGNTDLLRKHLQTLEALAPDAPEVRSLRAKYQR